MTAGEPAPSALRMSGVSKHFGAVQANADIDLELRRGEILGLLGENGAGKSTLMNILFGLVRPDTGSIQVEGELIDMTSSAVALGHGIGMVHQHFMLIPAFTVLENLVLGAEPARRGVLDRVRARESVVTLSEHFGLQVDPDALVSELGVAARQRVEILRAVYRGARILVLDEPTAVLSPLESERLFVVLREMAADGMSLILISHKLQELLSLTDRVTVIRDGRVIDTVVTRETSAQRLATLMVGRETSLDLAVAPHERSPQPLLKVRGLTVASNRFGTIDLDVHGGEIVGLAGVDGSGQTELLEAVVGLAPVTAGSIEVDGHDVTTSGKRRRLSAGLVYVPEDRSTEGLVGGLTVQENSILRRQRRAEFHRSGLLSPRLIREHAHRVVDGNDVRPRGVDHLAAALSGGNQQKLLIGRELADGPRILVVSQPTRGVDIAASRAIQRRLLAAREQGRAVLVASLDLDELKALCDRILVLFGGQIVGEVSRAEATDEALGLLMAGGAR